MRREKKRIGRSEGVKTRVGEKRTKERHQTRRRLIGDAAEMGPDSVSFRSQLLEFAGIAISKEMISLVARD